jgi:hypothetical protein
MKKSVLSVLALVAVAGAASAADHPATITSAQHFAPGQPIIGNRVVDANAIYSNVTTALTPGTFQANGGSTLQGTNTITNLIADDLGTIAYPAGASITATRFVVTNNNTAPITVRPRLRFWLQDGASGAPGTYLNGAPPAPVAPVGFTFNPVTFAPGSTILTGTFLANQWVLPGTSANIWYGITFDNNNNTTGANATQMNNLGMLLYGTPDVGTSGANAWGTNAAGSFFGTANPAGAFIQGPLDPSDPFGGTRLPANFGLELVIPTPSSVALLGLGGLLAARRRRA